LAAQPQSLNKTIADMTKRIEALELKIDAPRAMVGGEAGGFVLKPDAFPDDFWTFDQWKTLIADTISWAWSEIVKTAQNILDTLGALTKAAIKALLTSWEWICDAAEGLGKLAWNLLTKTAQNILDTIGDWATMIADFGNIAWSYITKTAQNILDVIGNWATMIADFGNLAWSYITKTATDIMNTIASWANILAKVGAMSVAQITTLLTSTANVISALGNWAWTQITKTAAQVMATISTWANIIAQVGNLAWSYVTKTAQNICDTLVSWTNMATKFGVEIATSLLTGIIESANFALSSLATGFFTGATGLAKFIAGFFTADSTGRNKFADEFIVASKIAANTITAGEIAANTITADEIASNTITANEIAAHTVTANEIFAGTITATELYSGEVMANRISAIHLRTDTAVITASAQIQDAIVTNLKILSGSIEFTKVNTEFALLSYFRDNRSIMSAESLTGYQVSTNESGEASTRRNYLKLKSGTVAGGAVWVMGYPISDCSHDNQFKAKVKMVALGSSTAEIYITLGDTSGQKYLGFMCEFIVGTGQVLRTLASDGTNYENTTITIFTAGDEFILEAKNFGNKIEFWVDGVKEREVAWGISSGLIEDLNAAVNNGGTASNCEVEIFYFTTVEDWL